MYACMYACMSEYMHVSMHGRVCLVHMMLLSHLDPLAGMILQRRPVVTIASPPCTEFSKLVNMNRHMSANKDVLNSYCQGCGGASNYVNSLCTVA